MVNMLGIGFDANSSYLRGASQAPNKIRQMQRCGSANEWCERGHFIGFGDQITDLGDITFDQEIGSIAFDKIYSSVTAILAQGHPLISIGGDHSIAYPIIKAHVDKYGPLTILQIDAHGDLYENFEGNHYSHASPFARLHEEGCLLHHTQIGIRSLNGHQREQIVKYGIRCIEMKDWNADQFLSFDHPIYLTLDVDGIDPAFAPGVSHHEPGGLTSRAVIDLIHKINVPIIGADIVEINPSRDINDMTAMLGYKLLKEIVSKIIYP